MGNSKSNSQNRIEHQHQTQTQTEEEEERESNKKTNMIKIIDVDLNNKQEAEDEDEEEDEEQSFTERLVKIEKNELNSAVIDTTNAFLELLQLDTMSKHLEEMRDRRMFLEKAANDIDLPQEEREIAAWITDTYLSKSPTTNYTQTILENIINKQLRTNTGATKEEKEKEKEKEKKEKEKEKEIKLSPDAMNEIILSINSNILSLNADKISTLLSSINEWNFNVFDFVELCDKSSLSLLMVTICGSKQILSNLHIDRPHLIRYMDLIDVNYLQNPYHNHIHACDVLLNMYYFMKSSIFVRNISFLDCFSVLIAACVHDVGHPGHGNSFEINTESALAVTYNDQSVLENMHISLAWKLLKSAGSENILSSLSKSESRRFRLILISSVLATDMSQHSLHSQTLDKLVDKYESFDGGDIPRLEKEKFADDFLPIALHTADLGNLCKETKTYNEWVDRLMNEFFNQGDAERQLGIAPISFLCDREKVNIHSGQVGFINFVIRPWFIKFGRLLSEHSHNALFLDLLNENLKYMQERANQTKDAQEEIKKNQHLLASNLDIVSHESGDQIKPLATISKPNIIPVDINNIPLIPNPRTSKSYSIVAMSFGEIKSKLLEYEQKLLCDKHNNNKNNGDLLDENE